MINKTRRTLETQIDLQLDWHSPDKDPAARIDTGVGFLDHMLTLFAFHSELYLGVQAQGDYQVDDHHTVEDVGILLGEAIRDLYQDKGSYQRYGSFYIPMDESLARVVLDLSGRPHLQFHADLSQGKVGSFDTELVREFFNGLAMNARMTLHIDLLRGGNTHHEIEAMFKAFARALKLALASRDGGIPSSKGLIA